MGFFTRADMKARVLSKKQALPPKIIHQLGVRALKDINPNAFSPNIQPEIVEDSDALVLLDWPSEADDKFGKHCSGVLGSQYRRRIDKHHRRVSFDYICRTRPPSNRDATAHEIEAHRPEVEATILACRPAVIYALGYRVVDWLLPGIGYSMHVHRGRVFRAKIKGHAFFIVATHPPREAEWLFDKGDKRGSPESIRRHVWADLDIPGPEGAVWASSLNDGKKIAVPEMLPRDKDELLTRFGARVVTACSPEAIASFAGSARQTIALDFESINLRPYSVDSRVLSIGLSDGRSTLSMAVDIPEHPTPASVLLEFKKQLVKLLIGRRIYAHNLAHDLEWLLHFLGREMALQVMRGVKAWRCTDVGAYVLDQRDGKSLDYLCQIYFGLPLKKLSPQNAWNRTDVRSLLEYGALDAALCYAIAGRQLRELKRLGRWDHFCYRMERTPALVQMQIEGFPVSGVVVKEMLADFTERQKLVQAEIQEHAEVKKAIAERGSFSPSSTDDVLHLFRDVMGYREALYRDAQWTTDSEALGEVSKALGGERNIAALILMLRDINKKLGTYLRRFVPEASNSYVYPDGKIHSRYLVTRTDTARLACVEPNGQNWPKRKGKEIRRVVKSPDGWIIVSNDLGQIEARMLGALTLDKHVIRMFNDPDYDIHHDWAVRLANAYPDVMKIRGFENIKAFRSAVKNEFVFPAYYGAGAPKISRATKIPEGIIREQLTDFWKQFTAVKAWQRRQVNAYERQGYLKTKLGFVRHGPLNYNMILNTEPQSLGSELCVEAAVRMHAHAVSTGEHWWAPIGNIHDDLIYCIPESRLAEFVPVVVRNTIVTPHKFAQVLPLTCELETGKDWANMQTQATFSSDQLDGLS